MRTSLTVTARTKARSDYELVVTNDRAEPVRFEAEIAPGSWTLAPQAAPRQPQRHEPVGGDRSRQRYGAPDLQSRLAALTFSLPSRK